MILEDRLKMYKGIRYVHGGNALHGADCFGIIKLFNEREFAIDIGDYQRTMPHLACRSIDAFYKQIVADGIWKPVEVPYTGCTVVLSSTIVNGKRIADHVGIYVEPGQLLNINMVMGCSDITPLNENSVLGFYEFNIERKEN